MADFSGFGFDAGGSMALIWASNGFSWLVSVGMQIALLVVVLTVVKRQRRDAASWLLAAAVLGLGVSIAGPVVGWGGAFLAGELGGELGIGIEGMLLAQALLGIVGSVVQVVIFVLLIRGIVALARPAA